MNKFFGEQLQTLIEVLLTVLLATKIIKLAWVKQFSSSVWRLTLILSNPVVSFHVQKEGEFGRKNTGQA